MNFALKNRKLLKLIAILVSALVISVILFWSVLGTVWTQADFQVLDFVYQQAVKTDHTAESSPHIIYLSLTDETYTYFGDEILDRSYLAEINTVLAKFNPQAVAYDIIFVRPRNSASDSRFAKSIKTLGCVYLPMTFEFSKQPRQLQSESETAYKRLMTEYLKQPVEQGIPEPLYAARVVLQWDEFAEAAYHSGYINAWADPDGSYRHHVMLVKVNSGYLPTLSLAMFLDYAGISLDKVIVDWGKEIRIPATKESYLDEDVVIPIDEYGRTFIPFPQFWGKDFDNMSVHNFLEYAKDVNLQGNLAQLFENRFVFIGDLSQGATDIGQTALEENVPLIAIHTALLNGLLASTFYHKWPFSHAIFLICLIALALALASLPKASWVLYGTGSVILITLIGLTWWQFTNFVLFPVVTIGGSFLFIFVGLIVGLQVAISKQQAFIHNAFARYVPAKVVEELISHPEKLTLGGEERVISILFSDLQGFTAISEQMSPQQLVQLLNHYLTEMTKIIINEGGAIDKYQGDAIMAEFGVPLPVNNHADLAVTAALKMQRRLHELRQDWAERGLPELQCRIGINTGLVIVGNMGSEQVFDYTVIGDAANLASRLEGANKRYNTFLMISESAYNALTPNHFHTRVLDVIKVKGKTEAVKVFEVYGESSDPFAPGDGEYYQTYQAAFEAYLSRDFANAREQFVSALQLRPNDPAASWMIKRIDEINPDELPEDWDGSIKLISK